jgi:tetratricopeptide (TPR) repeat protein
MRATLDWSYEWLTETEQAFFRRLAIFHGGWTTETIVAASPDEFDFVDVLSSLVDKSIVVAELRGDAQRYRLMEPLRQYGLERLKEAGEFEALADRHARYFKEFAQRAATHWRTASEPAALQKIEDEIDNVRAALEWALIHRNDAVLGAELADYLGNFWLTRHYHEGIRWLECAQAAIGFEEHPTLSGAITAHRLRSYAQADRSAMLPLCEEAIPRLRNLGNNLPLRRALFFYGAHLMSIDRLGEAERAFDECLGWCDKAGDAFLNAWSRLFLGRVYRKRGEFERGRAVSTKGCELVENLGIPLDRNRWMVFAERARLAQLAGGLDRAIGLCRDGLSLTQLTQDPLGGVQIEYVLAAFLFLAGAGREARAHARAVLRVSREELLPHGIAPGVQVLAGVAALQGRREMSARLLGYAEKRFSEQSHPRNALVDVDPEWFIQPLRSHFAEAELFGLMTEGAAWSEDRAIQEALAV